jgi:hypothetical protein
MAYSCRHSLFALFLAWLIQCAVKRCWSTVGESPTRELVRSTR